MTGRQTQQLKKAFLVAFAEHGNVSQACRTVGLAARSTVYRWQEHDDDFAAAYREAELVANDAINTEIRRRGLEGWLEPVYQGGLQVGVIRKFSDTLLIFLAKGRMPEVYRERVEHSGPGGAAAAFTFTLGERVADAG